MVGQVVHEIEVVKEDSQLGYGVLTMELICMYTILLTLVSIMLLLLQILTTKCQQALVMIEWRVFRILQPMQHLLEKCLQVDLLEHGDLCKILGTLVVVDTEEGN